MEDENKIELEAPIVFMFFIINLHIYDEKCVDAPLVLSDIRMQDPLSISNGAQQH